MSDQRHTGVGTSGTSDEPDRAGADPHAAGAGRHAGVRTARRVGSGHAAGIGPGRVRIGLGRAWIDPRSVRLV